MNLVMRITKRPHQIYRQNDDCRNLVNLAGTLLLIRNNSRINGKGNNAMASFLISGREIHVNMDKEGGKTESGGPEACLPSTQKVGS